MEYTFTERLVDNIQILRCENSETGEYLEIIPKLGGTVRQIGLADPGSNGIIRILEEDRIGEITGNPWFRGRFLFPFNDRIPGGKYTFDRIEYSLPVNAPDSNDSIHGLIYNKQVTDLKTESSSSSEYSESSASLSWKITAGPAEGYPFQPSLMMRVIFTPGCVGFSATVKNTGESSLPFGLGWHPYFTLADQCTTRKSASFSTVNNYNLYIPASKFIQVDDNLIPSGKKPDVRNSVNDFSQTRKIGSRDLDIGYTELNGSVVLSRGNRSLIIRQDVRAFPYVQAFIPPGRSSIALEPVSAGTNAFNIPSLGLVILNPGAEWKGKFSVELKSGGGGQI